MSCSEEDDDNDNYRNMQSEKLDEELNDIEDLAVDVFLDDVDQVNAKRNNQSRNNDNNNNINNNNNNNNHNNDGPAPKSASSADGSQPPPQGRGGRTARSAWGRLAFSASGLSPQNGCRACSAAALGRGRPHAQF